MRLIYTLLFYLLLPLVLLRLYWRGFKATAYRLRWQERLGFYQTPVRTNVIWFHAVSVGEAEAAFPLIKLLQSCYPQEHYLVTTTTPTGSARVLAVLGDTVSHVYLPYDVPLVLNRFLRHFQPKLAVMVEKEIWPNLFAACAAQDIPIFLINARLSARSARSYQKISRLMKPALASIKQIAVQTRDDQNHFIEIGALPEQLIVMGNVKFDVAVPADVISTGLSLKHRVFPKRYVWIAASTHNGEEAIILELYTQLKTQIPELLLLLVPRHPERFLPVKKLCEDQQLAVVMRSQHTVAVTEEIDVYLADTMGELKMLYAAADVAFVAGSLVPVGGHNVLEPATVGVPVLFGPQMFNFQEIAHGMLANAAALQCVNPAEILTAILTFYTDTDFRQNMIINAKAFVEKNQGATQKTADLLARYF